MPAYEADLSRFEGYDAQVLGISIDSTDSNRAWAQSLGGISYPLLSDFWPHGAVMQKYGVLRENGTAKRTVMVVDKQGKIAYIDVHDQDEQPDNEVVLDFLRKLP